jgi:hypothetical protein
MKKPPQIYLANFTDTILCAPTWRESKDVPRLRAT